MAASPSKPNFLSVLRRIEFSLNNGNFPSLNLKPLQMKCFEYMLEGQDVIGVLPTRFGKSMVFHLLPHFIPVKTTKNIVIVVCSLNSIIEDQLKVLKARRITADVLQLAVYEKEPVDNLFGNQQEPSEHVVPDSTKFPQDVVNGNTSIVFAHPEALLSKERRELMASKVFQDNVVACIVDEAHCVELWGEDFRKDFKDLSVLKAFFPSVPTMALTATAPPHLLRDLKQSLRLKNDCKIVARNPNRVNTYLDKKPHLSNHHGNESYDKILVPIANELAIQRENYPMTIIYLKLKYCGYAYGLFERVLKDKQCVGETSEPSARLFSQFHAPQTSRTKKDIISEIKKEQSRVRVLFAASALGMGVDAPYVTNIIHITPPSSLEAYMQEIGRAGRTGLSSCATLYYNNSDIGNNKKHVEESMKSYCRSEDTCQRKLLLDYFGFSSVQQKSCCCICDGKFKRTEEDLPQAIRNKVRFLPNSNRAILERLIKSAISDHESHATSEGSMLFDISVDTDLAAKVMEGVEFVASEADLLKSFGIWDETCSSQIFSLISEHTAICTTETDSDND
ncbi:ATP-dependent DNA helicase Q1-like [Montipora capricornis]|uniref:ATP-dependent DNA helicase Q1-like n=1 Tax=Montipora capricornis TaxID=246305 RepID=UPI0035F189D0